MKQIQSEMQISLGFAPVSANAASFTATAVDARGFDRACHVITLGVMANTATFDAYIQESATSGGSYANTTSAALVQVADTGGGKIYTIDHAVNAAKPYLKIVAAAGTAAVLASETVILYRGSHRNPPTQNATQAVIV